MPRCTARIVWSTLVLVALAGSVAAARAARASSAPPAAPPAVPPVGSGPATPDASAVQFTIGEAPLLEWLRAATPYSVTVGNQFLSTGLILTDPSDLRLKDGKASLKIRVKSRTLPIEQVVSPVITLSYDRSTNRYFGVLASLPLDIPGLGSIDLRDSVPRFEIPSVLENLWKFSDRPVGLNVRIRRVAILDRALEIGAEISFGPVPPMGARSAR